MATDELRATARLYAHLLAADALPWHAILGRVRVTEDDTTSSSRIFIKMLFQDLAEHLGIRALSNKMNDDEVTAVRDALFPRDCAKNTRFAINFFTAIDLGGVTETARKLIV
jgi:pre-mRNA-splicing factor CWC22